MKENAGHGDVTDGAGLVRRFRDGEESAFAELAEFYERLREELERRGGGPAS